MDGFDIRQRYSRNQDYADTTQTPRRYHPPRVRNICLPANQSLCATSHLSCSCCPFALLRRVSACQNYEPILLLLLSVHYGHLGAVGRIIFNRLQSLVYECNVISGCSVIAGLQASRRSLCSAISFIAAITFVANALSFRKIASFCIIRGGVNSQGKVQKRLSIRSLQMLSIENHC